MAFPICEKCASSNMLCESCEQKVREGRISELDFLVSALLAQHGVKGYESLVDFETKLVIFASDEDASAIIGPGGNTVAELSKKLGRKIAVISRSWDKDLIIKSLARPSRLVAQNKVFTQGDEKVKLIFDKPIDEGSLKLMKELVGGIEVEYQPYKK
jgi:transcription antitermination factor NusA-like protein